MTDVIPPSQAFPTLRFWFRSFFAIIVVLPLMGVFIFHEGGDVGLASPNNLAKDLTTPQFSQQGPKLVATGLPAYANQGYSVSVSADGNTAIVAGPGDGNMIEGTIRVWTRTGGLWTQQGPNLIGSGAVGNALQGISVSISADGNTAIIGGMADDNHAGAAWVWTSTEGVWTQQGPKLVGTGTVGVHTVQQGRSVSLSADGNTAIVGGHGDNYATGAAWVWTRSGGVWTQQGSKLVGSGAAGAANQGGSVSISADGNTVIVGGQDDNIFAGAVWIWTRSGGIWTQQGPKLVGTGGTGLTQLGWSVSLSADGNTAIAGGPGDNNNAGASWVWTRTGGVWSQQGPRLVGTAAAGNASQGKAVSLSADGNRAIIGGPYDNDGPGAAWVWSRMAGVWTQIGTKLVGSDVLGASHFGSSVSLSGDGNTVITGGPADQNTGAAWVFISVTQTQAQFDFDGDCKSDVSVFRPSTGYWYISNSSNNSFRAEAFGATDDQIVPADYDGDGKTDIAVWRPSTGYWYSMDSSTGAFRANNFGQIGDIPLPADFDGDGKSDICVFRASNSTFYLLRSSDASFRFQQWGQSGDVPVVSDYDGDRKADFGVYRGAISGFYYLRSSDGAFRGQQWGVSGDRPIAADFDADGKTDIAVYRPSDSSWYWMQSSDDSFRAVNWGTGADVPAAGDYDGDGKWDVAVFRPSSGTFYILQSTLNSVKAEQFGISGDVPTPSAYVP